MKKFGIIKYKNIDFHYYVYGYRGGRGLAVYKQYLNEKSELKQINKILQTFASWHFEPREEAMKIIKENFKLLNRSELK